MGSVCSGMTELSSYTTILISVFVIRNERNVIGEQSQLHQNYVRTKSLLRN